MKIFEKIKVNKEREIQLFGVPIVQYGEKDGTDSNAKYIDLFPKSLEHRTLDKILSYIPKEHDHIWLVRTSGLGEAQLLNFEIKELIKRYNAKNPCFVSHRNIYKELFKMYSDIPFYTLDMEHDEYAWYLRHRNVCYKNRGIHIHHCTLNESLNWLGQKKSGNTEHAIDSYKTFANIEKFANVFPNFSEDIKKQTIEKIQNIELDINKFIFIAPEANGTCKINDDVWCYFAEACIKKGYDIFVNTANGYTNYGKSVYLNIAEATYLASLAKAIIGLRCGFMEILAAIKDRMTLYTLYTPFRGIDAENFYKIYTLKEYPFFNAKNTFEFVVSKNNALEVIKKIIGEL